MQDIYFMLFFLTNKTKTKTHTHTHTYTQKKKTKRENDMKLLAPAPLPFHFERSFNQSYDQWDAISFMINRMPFHYISIALNLVYNKNKLYKALDYWSRDMLNFNFPEKVLGLVSSQYFVYDFSRKMFLMLYSINWPSFIRQLPLLLEILGNMCMTIVC